MVTIILKGCKTISRGNRIIRLPSFTSSPLFKKKNISFCLQLKSRLHYQSFLVQENLVKVFDANFDSVNGQRKL